MNVFTGTVLRNAQAKVADIYSSPLRNKYCVRVNLIDINNSQRIRVSRHNHGNCSYILRSITHRTILKITSIF
jgi:hypothetical protein